MDATVQEYKVTYYVGLMLAQGGTLKIQEDHLLFVPRNIEKAMGAVDVEIPFSQIKLVEVTGSITEFLMVRTQEKAHKFVGSDLQKVCEQINSALSNSNPKFKSENSAAPTSAPASDGMAKRVQQVSERTGSSASCPGCFKILKPDYNFCPACGMAIKKLCSSCKRGLDVLWKHCAACGAAV